MAPSHPARLLVVEDAPPHHGALAESLIEQGYRVDTAPNGPAAIEKLGTSDYGLVLLDHLSSGANTLDLLRLLRATRSSSELPVIVLAGEDDMNHVVQALDGGANDYVLKPVEIPLITARIDEHLSRANQRGSSSPSPHETDPLTGLGNRAAMTTWLTAWLRNHPPAPILLLVVDLDGFSIINDSFGESTGDHILAEIAARIQTSVASCPDVRLARIGGDEFAVLAAGVSAKDAEKVAARILEAVVRPMIIDELQVSSSASIGVFSGTPESSTAEDLLRDAHLALYRAKELGKNRWHLFTPDLRTRARARLALIHDLRYALERDELRTYYQPKFNLETRQIVGFEALLRWQHPVRGLVAPNDFIPLAEETGLIVPIGEWILREACRQLHAWDTRFLALRLNMNVNLSVHQLIDPDVVDRVRLIIEESSIAPTSLNLELTETALMTNLESARSVLSELRTLRVGLKLDDFGTGYSSLGYLTALHFDSLKIDRGFVSRMTCDHECHAIVESITGLARALGMTLVAEGVEREEHVHELLRLGCQIGQGFYFSPAVPAAAATEMIATERSSCKLAS